MITHSTSQPDRAPTESAGAHPCARAGHPGLLSIAASLLRVPEWAKNVFVAAPLLFSGQLVELGLVWRVLLASAALCAVSSSIYIVNDLIDRERDLVHPVKRARPIASGAVPVPAAMAIAVGLLMTGAVLLASACVAVSVWSLVAGFFALNLGYSLYLKRKVIIDVLAIAVGYVVRVLIGGAVVGVEVTHWLVLCTFLLATFLGFSKRRHELTQLGPGASHHRPVLSLYSEEFLDHASLLTLAMTLTCYFFYTIAPETVERFGTHALVYSGLIVMFSLFRYLFLIHVKKMGSPVEVLYYDRQIVLAVLCWTVYVIAVVYTWPAISGRMP